MFLIFVKEILRGKSLSRVLVNLKLKKAGIALSGKALDLGGSQASYLRFLNTKEAEIMRLNADKASQPDITLDLEKERLPFVDESIDNILCFNILEHIFNYQFLASEIFRVLKPGGRVYGSAPFLNRFHPDPDDFFRFSPSALQRIFNRAGFSKIKIVFIGYGPLTASYNQEQALLPAKMIFTLLLRFCLAFWVIVLDKLFLRIKPSYKEKFALAYFFILEK